MNAFLFILINNIIPIFILIIVGYMLSRKFEMNILTLTKLNFYIFIPAFTFLNIYTTKIPIEMLKVLAVIFLVMVSNYIISVIISKIRGYKVEFKNAFCNSLLFYNSGNIGIPLITLVFSSFPFIIGGKTPYLSIALTVQIVVLVFQNITTNTIGFINAGRAKYNWKDSVLLVLKMPAVYSIPLAFILKGINYDFTTAFFWPAIKYASDALVPIALITLGVQLSKTSFVLKNKEVYLSVIIRLIGGPLIALAFIYALGMDGVIAQTVMISSAAPTAVNSALIAVETDNCPDFASQVVMTSTLFCAISLVFVIYTARILFPV